MADYILSCCSTADLSKEHFDSREIHYICFHFMLDGVDYPDDLGVSVPFDEFYRRAVEEYGTQYIRGRVSAIQPDGHGQYIVRGAILIGSLVLMACRDKYRD